MEKYYYLNYKRTIQKKELVLEVNNMQKWYMYNLSNNYNRKVNNYVTI